MAIRRRFPWLLQAVNAAAIRITGNGSSALKCRRFSSVTRSIHGSAQSDLMRPCSATRRFQALQQATMMSSVVSNTPGTPRLTQPIDPISLDLAA